MQQWSKPLVEQHQEPTQFVPVTCGDSASSCAINSLDASVDATCVSNIKRGWISTSRMGLRWITYDGFGEMASDQIKCFQQRPKAHMVRAKGN